MAFCIHKNSADDFSSTLKIIEPFIWGFAESLNLLIFKKGYNLWSMSLIKEIR